MEKIVLKYNATRVDEIEKAKGVPIENCIADNSVSNLALFLQKGLVNGDGSVGCTRTQAIELIDEYLSNKENDKDELVLDVTEALVDSGFLSRTLDVNQMRKLKTSREKQLVEEMNKIE